MVAAYLGLGILAGAAAERYGLPLPSFNAVKGSLVETDAQIEFNAFALAKSELVSEEGRRSDAYLDSRGILTVGIGHKVLSSDNIKLGQVITDARIDDLFSQDLAPAFSAAKSQAREINKYNAEMIARLTSVNFQLGTYWRTKFPNTWSLIKNGKIQQAINNLYDSAWYQQTPNRVIAFASTLQNQFA